MDFLFSEVTTVIERGNMTDEEYIAALEKENKNLNIANKENEYEFKRLLSENKSLKSEKSKLEKKIDKLVSPLQPHQPPKTLYKQSEK